MSRKEAVDETVTLARQLRLCTPEDYELGRGLYAELHKHPVVQAFLALQCEFDFRLPGVADVWYVKSVDLRKMPRDLLLPNRFRITQIIFDALRAGKKPIIEGVEFVRRRPDEFPKGV